LRLTERVAEFHGVPAECVIVGAGTTELISLIAASLRDVLAQHAQELGDPRMAMSHLIEPCYAEYRRASTLNNLRVDVHKTHIMGWEQDFFPKQASGINWTGHPNNPTGRAWDRKTLLDHVDASGALLTVVDEAYLAFLPDEAERTLCGDVVNRDNLMVMRSMTKIYSIAGLRVGYALASPEMVDRLKRFQDPWTITVPAEFAAIECLNDDEYIEETRGIVIEESERMFDALWDIPGLRPAWPGRERPDDVAGFPNFLLVSLTDTPWTSVQVHEAMARRGVLIRECSNYAGLEMGAILTGPGLEVLTKGHLRFAVRCRDENDRLLEALESVMKSQPPR
jgi:threonine-phosphate decarboxylase